MTVMDAGSFFALVSLWLVGFIAAAVAAMYFLRPRTRRLYPGGKGRYLLALIVQVTGFVVPIPVVTLALLDKPISQQFAVVLAVAAGVLVVFALRAAPVTGPLLKDMHKARVAAVVERLERRS